MAARWNDLLHRHITVSTPLVAQRLAFVAAWKGPPAALLALNFLCRLRALHILFHVPTGKLLVNNHHTQPTLLVARLVARVSQCTANVGPRAVFHAQVLQVVWVPGSVALLPALMTTAYSRVAVLGAGEGT